MIDREVECKLYHLYKLCELIVSGDIKNNDTKNALIISFRDSIKELNVMLYVKEHSNCPGFIKKYAEYLTKKKIEENQTTELGKLMDEAGKKLASQIKLPKF